jgi:hypothetical protein
MFIPTGVKPGENKVHIFFGPGGVSGNRLNHITCHALRAAVADTDWILISAAGIQDSSKRDLPNPISAGEVLDILAAHGRPRRVDELRLSSHSRGNAGLAASLNSKQLVAPKPSGSVFSGSIVGRVVAFDEDGWNTKNAASVAGIDPKKVFGFRVTEDDWSLSQVVNVPKFPNGDICLKAVGWSRLIEDARVVNPGLKIPADLDQMVTDLALPRLGLLTSRKNPPAPFENFQDFCTAKWTSVIKPPSFKTQKLGDFVLAKDLAGVAPFNGMHHFFLAEFAHEVTDVLPPEP